MVSPYCLGWPSTILTSLEVQVTPVLGVGPPWNRLSARASGVLFWEGRTGRGMYVHQILMYMLDYVAQHEALVQT